MFWFKACPRCHGDLYSEGDTYGSYLACIQCGHYLSEAEESRLSPSNTSTDRVTLEPVGVNRLAA